MTDIPLAEAKARLSELIVRAAAGEPIRITKRGKPVAEISGVASPRLPIRPVARCTARRRKT